jgi:formylmethanofuran dehydrogenase subunit E
MRQSAIAAICIITLGAGAAHAGDPHPADTATTRSRPDRSEWNRGVEPKDWWAEIESRHGHVGPWNVLGYRMGKAILRETKTAWGEHAAVITSHIPLDMPYSCIVDGLAVGTGNSEGRLDLKVADVAAPEFIHISARMRDGSATMILTPRAGYLEKITGGTAADLHRLSRECAAMPEGELFEVRTATR